MPRVPVKVSSRIRSGLKRYQPILTAAKSRDVNESDTVTIVTDLVHEVFGFDKFEDVTSEHSIRGTFCDLAIQIGGKVSILIEVKAIGFDLKAAHIKQAVDYAANQGVDWVFLTNGDRWHVYRLKFGRPIDSELVTQFSLIECDPKNSEHLETLFMLSKDGWRKEALADFHERCQAFNRFTVAAAVMTEPVIRHLRQRIRKASRGLKVSNEEIEAMLMNEVLKREVVEGDRAVSARRLVGRSMRKSSKAGDQASSSDDSVIAMTDTVVAPEPLPHVDSTPAAESTC